MGRGSITAVLNAHREGMLAKPSLDSLKRAVALAEKAGFQVETLAVLDRADALTREVVKSNGPDRLRLEDVDFGDLGLARNHGAAKAQGHYVAFLDAGIPAVDVIDLDYAQWHTAVDNLDAVSARSLQIVGDVLVESLPKIVARLQH